MSQQLLSQNDKPCAPQDDLQHLATKGADPIFPVENARALCQRLSQGSLNLKILQLDLTCICGEREGLVFEFRVLQFRAQKLTVYEDSQVLVTVIEQRPGQAVPTPNADTCLQVG